MAGRLEGKVAWVTGAGSGIGRAAAVALAKEGAKVALTGRRAAPLEETAGMIGGGALAVPADLTDAAQVTAAVATVVDKLGRLDIVVSNAGLNAPERRWAVLKAETISALVDGNLKAPAYVAQAALPALRKSKGIIVHVASWAGRFIGHVSGPTYVAAKHGLVALSHTLNMEECGNGVRSTVVEPGEVNTPIMDLRPVKLPPEVRAAMLQPEDVAAAVLFAVTMPAHACINEILISPTANRGYLAEMARAAQG
ncbi:SDR family oxidoreductase [Elioraea rosea]|uniref:SDR family oxidoreductase n=1 Tax=Elioraea rosea TaxID=2492390 RepID=UPI0011836144|nr:SDR family NAD(P)-dependent oxidoreductase [Elioraea rosea]